MSVLETKRKMTSREQIAYDLGIHEGRNTAIVHGRWKSLGLCSLECSVCGFVDIHKMLFKHCPECGAKMDGD